MATPVWPTSLPQRVQADSYSEQTGVTTIRSDVDTGPVKVRARFTASIDPIKGSIFLDVDFVDVLKAFYKTDLANGSKQFLFPNQVNGTPSAARFTSPPAYKCIGGRNWQADLQLELLP